jgi:hypothetical protein
LSQTNHWYVNPGAGNPCQLPLLTARLEPKTALPEITGAETESASELEGTDEADQRLVDPMVFVLVVLAVTNFPASSGVWV